MIVNPIMFMNMIAFFPLGIIGPWQVLIIALVIVLLFGGKKIPELMKGVGKGVKSFKEGMSEVEKDIKDIKQEVESSAKEPDEIKKIDENN